MLEIFIFLLKKVNLKRKTQYAVITRANTFNGIKIPTFFWDDVILVPLSITCINTIPINSKWSRYCAAGGVLTYLGKRGCAALMGPFFTRNS